MSVSETDETDETQCNGYIDDETHRVRVREEQIDDDDDAGVRVHPDAVFEQRKSEAAAKRGALLIEQRLREVRMEWGDSEPPTIMGIPISRELHEDLQRRVRWRQGFPDGQGG